MKGFRLFLDYNITLLAKSCDIISSVNIFRYDLTKFYKNYASI